MDFKSQGYSKEEEYFFKKDRELLAKLKEKSLQNRKKLEEEHKKDPSWMRCPKCGTTMVSENYKNLVTVDRCPGCDGVYLDQGELELILKAKPGLLAKILGA